MLCSQTYKSSYELTVPGTLRKPQIIFIELHLHHGLNRQRQLGVLETGEYRIFLLG